MGRIYLFLLQKVLSPRKSIFCNQTLVEVAQKCMFIYFKSISTTSDTDFNNHFFKVLNYGSTDLAFLVVFFHVVINVNVLCLSLLGSMSCASSLRWLKTESSRLWKWLNLSFLSLRHFSWDMWMSSSFNVSFFFKSQVRLWQRMYLYRTIPYITCIVWKCLSLPRVGRFVSDTAHLTSEAFSTFGEEIQN